MKIYSVNIGVSHTDLGHYGNNLIPLPCCVTDARYMHGFANIFDYDGSMLLLDEEATVQNVKGEIHALSNVAKKGDLVIVSYSGHGSVIRDYHGDEKGASDQTWCLYDRQIIDDEFRYLWKEFDEGVNIFLVIDSCHSGSAYKTIAKNEHTTFPADYSRKVKSIIDNKANVIFENNKDLYDPIRKMSLVQENEVKCFVTAITACQDDQEALAGPFLSVFTELLIKTLASESDELKKYNDLLERIAIQSNKEHGITPKISHFGKSTDFFNSNKPFVKKNADYPAGISNLYTVLEDGEEKLNDKSPQNNGLIVDIEDESGKAFIEQAGTDELSLVSQSGTTYLVYDEKVSKAIAHPWDKAYELYDDLREKGIQSYVEPDLIPPKQEHGSIKKSTGAGDFLKYWPKPVGEDNIFTWHLDDTHSQLAAARDLLIKDLPENRLDIKIGHIDTGYNPHPAIPSKMEKGISYVKGEEGQPAYEKPTPRLIEQEDHGTFTACLLAGKEVSPTLGYGTGSMKLGAVPFATVYPIRISETVALSSILGNAMPFVKAVEKAIEEKCEVITMSMGGLPSRAWAKVINKAYEAGITIVTAAGNSWAKGLAKITPSKILYPARFDRVIAVTGVCYNHYPYVAEANPDFGVLKSIDGEFMQGNHLPLSAMKTAIAAYTPNVPRATFADKDKQKPTITKNGAGTSSATPQVAAAAAMWIVKNKQELIDKGYHGTWKQVEAVRYALFNSARKKSIVGWEKYYGNGILKAKNALGIRVPESNELQKAARAKVTLGIYTLFKVAVLKKSTSLTQEDYDERKAEMVFQEVIQVLEQDQELIKRYGEIDLVELEQNNNLSEDQLREICKQVARSEYSSDYLKSLLF